MNSLLILVVCLFTCAGQLCQKKAVQNWQVQAMTWQGKLFDPWLISAFGALGLGMLVWLLVLRLVPLNIAYPMLSLNFVLVTLASHYWFKEPTSGRYWWGVGLIMLGVALVGAHL